MSVIHKVFIFIGIFWLIQSVGFGQVVDDFSDGDFTNNPTWTGTPDAWVISSQQLRSNTAFTGTSPATFFLSTPSTLAGEGTWETYFRYASLNPTGGNHSDFWIMADSANLGNSKNGYFIKIGNTAKDICLYKRKEGNTTLIIDGPDQLIASASNSGNIKLTRSAIGYMELYAKVNGATEFVLMGSVTDNEISTSNFLGFSVLATTSNYGKHYYDDVKAEGVVGPDVTPPNLLNATIVSATQIDLAFSEPVDEAFSAQANQYTLSPNRTVTTAERQAGSFSTVRITISPALTAGEYTVTVLQSKDLAGNIQTTAQNKLLTYAPVVPATYRSIVINEIMAAPSANAGTSVPQVEWIELHNPGTDAINMTNWTIRDGSTAAPRVIPATVLTGGSFVILASAGNAALFDGIAQVAAVSLPALNNDKDSLVLADNNGIPVDIVVYSDTWYGDAVKKSGGYSLEQINPLLPCSGGFNWTGANFPDGGSPGAPNTVYSDAPDLIPPSLNKAEVFGGNKIILSFSEPLSPDNLPFDSVSVSNLSVTNIEVRTPNLQSITLTLSGTVQLGTVYDITISGVKDCAGNPAGTIYTNIGQGKKPVKFDLLITEIQADNSPDNQLPQAEYFEIFNASSSVIDLSGCTVNAGSTTTGRFPPFLLKPGEYVVACGTSYTQLFQGVLAVGVTSFPALSQDGSKLTLKNGDGQWIHQMHYSSRDFSPVSLLNAGWSLEMIDPSNVCDQISNWAVSTDPKGGTPGKPNSVKGDKPDLTPPVLKKVVVMSPTSVKLTWDELIDSAALAGLPITMPSGYDVEEKSIPASDFSSLQFNFSPALQPNQTISIILGLVRDCSGNVTNNQTITVSLPDKADANSWCLNEVLYNPFTGGVDFVEIKNVSDRYLDLTELQIGNRSEKRNMVAEPFVVAPGGFAVLTSSITSTLRDYPRGRVETFVETSLPSFNSDSGTVRIFGPGNALWQQFFYNDKMHVKILDATKGVSLERISCDLPVNETASWHSASKDAGYATPGYENSQTRPFNPDDAFSADPKTFSPNGDGNKDFTFFTYDQSKNGLIGNLRIYSADGFLIRNLAESANLGTRGFWQWDGTTEDGRKARMGIYIAVLETVELGGDTKYYKIPVAIAAER